MNKKIPMRRCVGCGESKPKQELIRITAQEEGVLPDPTGRANGRGIYLCRGNAECFAAAKKKKAIPRGLGKELSDVDMDVLEKELAKYEK